MLKKLNSYIFLLFFSILVYTSNDEWEMEISGELDSRTLAVKHANAERI